MSPSLQSPGSKLPHGSVGMFVGMLVMVVLLGVIAAAIGYFCSGSGRMGIREYGIDIEGWAERKCSSCIDGKIPDADVHVVVTAKAEENKQQRPL
ncbi:hypothetical protein SAY87_031534 [Trapa incisa]|uniref:Uncharacterized protein n=2 Tax=Trapa TaxID=22665 RepID=A0AAN7M0W9_TRANT|nr:hypothetical protein SAY87_031534 [Trapa incisa]KAK4796875.1 hypothetical protein SAY86_029201 [Trapa natans]